MPGRTLRKRMAKSPTLLTGKWLGKLSVTELRGRLKDRKRSGRAAVKQPRETTSLVDEDNARWRAWAECSVVVVRA